MSSREVLQKQNGVATHTELQSKKRQTLTGHRERTKWAWRSMLGNLEIVSSLYSSQWLFLK